MKLFIERNIRMKIGNTLAFYLSESIMEKVKRHYVEYYTAKEERGNRMKENQVKKLVMAAMCVALGIVLPMAFHTIQNAGSTFFAYAHSGIDLRSALWMAVWADMWGF